MPPAVLIAATCPESLNGLPTNGLSSEPGEKSSPDFALSLEVAAEVLHEARALYRACGYRPVGVAAIDGRMDLWLEKRL